MGTQRDLWPICVCPQSCLFALFTPRLWLASCSDSSTVSGRSKAERERGKQGGLIALQHVTQQRAGSDPTHQETLRATAALCCTGHEHVLHDSSGMKPVWYWGAHQEKCILGVTTPQGMSPPCLPLLEGTFQHVSLRSLCCPLYLESTALDGKSSVSFVFDLCQQASAKPAR